LLKIEGLFDLTRVSTDTMPFPLEAIKYLIQMEG